jgi:hypothetical protein
MIRGLVAGLQPRVDVAFCTAGQPVPLEATPGAWLATDAGGAGG